MDGLLTNCLNELSQAEDPSTATLIFTVALFFAAISGMNLSVRLRVSLIYAYCLIVSGLEDGISLITLAVGSAVALFLVLEVFNPDEVLVKFFSVYHKLLDFIYRMLFEYYGWAFYAILFLQSCPLWHNASYSFSGVISPVLTVILVSMVSRGRFSSLPITEIVEHLDKAGGNPATCHFSEEDQEKLDILLFMEDRTFFSRSEKQHFLSIGYILGRVSRRLRSLFSRIRKLTKESISNLLRGYGTIEMQILRNIGLSFGSYQFTVRRKFFELVFSKTVFNSYLEQLSKESDARDNFKNWILQCYLNVAPVKIGAMVCRRDKDGSTFQKLFKKDFHELSREEFFVWCLGLLNYKRGVGRIAVSMHRHVIDYYNLNAEKINEAINLVRSRSDAIT